MVILALLGDIWWTSRPSFAKLINYNQPPLIFWIPLRVQVSVSTIPQTSVGIGDGNVDDTGDGVVVDSDMIFRIYVVDIGEVMVLILVEISRPSFAKLVD